MDKKQDKKSFEALKANIKKDLAKNKESLQKDLKEEQNKKIHYSLMFENLTSSFSKQKCFAASSLFCFSILI